MVTRFPTPAELNKLGSNFEKQAEMQTKNPAEKQAEKLTTLRGQQQLPYELGDYVTKQNLRNDYVTKQNLRDNYITKKNSSKHLHNNFVEKVDFDSDVRDEVNSAVNNKFMESLRSEVNTLWNNTDINNHERDAEESMITIQEYETKARNNKNTINTYKNRIIEVLQEAEGYRNDAKTAKEDAIIASNTAKSGLNAFNKDYTEFLTLAKNSKILAEIIGHLAESSKILNSTTVASSNIAKAPFTELAESNRNGKPTVTEAIIQAMSDPVKTFGKFGYKGYPAHVFKKDLTYITQLRNSISNNKSLGENAKEYLEELIDIKNNNDYKMNNKYISVLPEPIKQVFEEALDIQTFSNMNTPTMEGFFNNVTEMCGDHVTDLYESKIGSDNANLNNFFGNEDESQRQGKRLKMCNAYRDIEQSNENILELEELLGKKKNLASDVMLNYILNEDNNNESTIKQAYDKTNDENNLKIRQIKNNEYINKKNIDNLKILKFAILLFLISIPFLILNKKEKISINLLFFVISILIVIFVIFSGTIIYKQLRADKFDYNKIEKSIKNINTTAKKNGVDNRDTFNRHKKFTSFFGCFNSDCCEEGTTYDNTLNKCISN